MQERHDKLFDIQFFADDGDESDDEKNKGGGSGGDPVILAEELTAGEFETLDKTFRRAYAVFAARGLSLQRRVPCRCIYPLYRLSFLRRRTK